LINAGQGVGEMDDRDVITMGNMFGYQVATLGVLLVAACTVYAVVALAEKLLSH
jgi:hypothetical protein